MKGLGFVLNVNNYLCMRPCKLLGSMDSLIVIIYLSQQISARHWKTLDGLHRIEKNKWFMIRPDFMVHA